MAQPLFVKFKDGKEVSRKVGWPGKQELKNWIIAVAKDFVNGSTAGAGELCDETVETAGTICDETKKANANFVKAIMENI